MRSERCMWVASWGWRHYERSPKATCLWKMYMSWQKPLFLSKLQFFAPLRLHAAVAASFNVPYLHPSLLFHRRSPVLLIFTHFFNRSFFFVWLCGKLRQIRYEIYFYFFLIWREKKIWKENLLQKINLKTIYIYKQIKNNIAHKIS